MNVWYISPFSQVGPLCFTMPRDQVHQELGEDYRVFKKTPSSVTDADAYTDLGIRLFYDNAFALDFIEISSHTIVPVRFQEIALFSAPYEDILANFAALGYTAIRDGDGCYFSDLGMSISSPDKVRIESVGLFEQRRFEKYIKLRREVAESRRLREERRRSV